MHWSSPMSVTLQGCIYNIVLQLSRLCREYLCNTLYYNVYKTQPMVSKMTTPCNMVSVTICILWCRKLSQTLFLIHLLSRTTQNGKINSRASEKLNPKSRTHKSAEVQEMRRSPQPKLMVEKDPKEGVFKLPFKCEILRI